MARSASRILSGIGIALVIAGLVWLVWGSRSAAPEKPVLGACYVGGCSNQLCTDQPNAVSTCEYTASYACYTHATCERQAGGQCGWTQTEGLRACLMETK